MSCERFLALGQRRAGAERVNPLPDAVPSSRPLRLACARAALWDAVGRRARSRWRLGRAPSRCGPVCLFLLGVLLKRGSVPTTRYKESSWVPWSGCIVVNPFLDIHISQSLPSPPSKRKLNTAAVLRRVTASDSCISYNHSSAVQSDCISASQTRAVSTQWPQNSQICRARSYWSRTSPRATPWSRRCAGTP